MGIIHICQVKKGWQGACMTVLEEQSTSLNLGAGDVAGGLQKGCAPSCGQQRR